MKNSRSLDLERDESFFGSSNFEAEFALSKVLGRLLLFVLLASIGGGELFYLRLVV